MIEPLLKELEPLVVSELSRANLVNPQFHSSHEGYAVLREEYQETSEELELMKHHLFGLWMSVRQNRPDSAKDHVECLKDRAMNVAAEAIQVAAMCDKYMNMKECD